MILACEPGYAGLLHHDLGTGDNHGPKVDRQLRQRAQGFEQGRYGDPRNQRENNHDGNPHPQQAHVPAVPDGNAECAFAVAAPDARKDTRYLRFGVGKSGQAPYPQIPPN
jgi:hypothetical protein